MVLEKLGDRRICRFGRRHLFLCLGVVAFYKIRLVVVFEGGSCDIRSKFFWDAVPCLHGSVEGTFLVLFHVVFWYVQSMVVAGLGCCWIVASD